MRLGILGGTFNPIHRAHFQMAAVAAKALSLDRVLMLVAADPPHKTVDDGVSAADRYRMTDLACREPDCIFPCDLELRRFGKSYTVDTLRTLKKQYPDSELFLIIGSDSLQAFSSWHMPGEILKLAQLVCVPRTGISQGDVAAADLLEKSFQKRPILLEDAVPEISSTMIRDRIEQALPISHLVDGQVEWYIYEHGLYFPESLKRIHGQVEKMLPRKRFLHTVGVMLESVRLANLWGADPQKARLAALLHDCAKYIDPRELVRLSGDDTGIEAVQHAFAGAAVAKEVFGIQDPQVLEAVRLHCTGDTGMELLDMVIYLADITERSRSFPGVEDYRRALEAGPEEAMLFALQRGYERLLLEGGGIHPATQRALQYFQRRLRK